jgi:hypothetical protein
MNRSWFQRLALTSIVLIFCVGLPAPPSGHSQNTEHGDVRRRASASDETANAVRNVARSFDGNPLPISAAPQAFKVTRKNADRFNENMATELRAITPFAPRGVGEPHLTEPPRLLNIRPVGPAGPAAAAAANGPSGPPNPHFEQSSAGPDLQTEKGPSYAGISHKETVLPGVPPPNNKFIVRTAPPDTVGAVGDDYYVQWVNTSFAVFRKNTGELLYGPTEGRILWKGFDNGLCERVNDGDPIVQYDKIHKRWVMAQFAFNLRVDPATGDQVPAPPFYQCIAVSTTSDPLGKYRRYRFQYSNFNDFPKIGVWTDGYYATFNMFGGPNEGAMVCAYDADVMLGLPTQSNGRPPRTASQQCVQLDSQYWSLLPADLDGNIQPPKGTPSYLVNLDPDKRAVNLWRFKVDWDNEANSQLTGPLPVVGVEEYAVPCLGLRRLDCIPQPGTKQKLESLADRVMYRLAYRRFADGHESLLLNHTVSLARSDGSSAASIRWYELRDPGGTPTVYQSGTFGPDANNRWIGSIAMDKLGNIGLAYSASGSTLPPSIYYTGRSADDSQKGRLGKEIEIVRGGGSQSCLLPNGQCDAGCIKSNNTCITNIARWGDYSSLTVDPSDDCTMWYTTEYLKNQGGFNWGTIIYSFRFKGCVSGAPVVSGTPVR